MKTEIIGILVCTLMITTTVSPVAGAVSNSEDIIGSDMLDSYTQVLVRIDTAQDLVELPYGLEIVGGKPGEWIDVIIPEYQIIDLSNANVEFMVLLHDVDAYLQAAAGDYHSLAEMEYLLEDIANEYPDITSLYSIGTTYEGRDIWCLEISDNPDVDEGEPGVFYMGLHHAREWPTLEICLHIADMLTSEYDTDPVITDIVNNRRLWLVPCVNPDGYYYCHDQGHDWRKNRHYFPEFDAYGVDLNRNYDGSCNGDAWGAWGSLGPGSVTHNPDYSVYCGPYAMSELETQAISEIFLQNDIHASISWHTHGELVMWPWGYSASEHTPDDTYMSQVGQEIASLITKQDGFGYYDPTQSSGLYPTTGDTTDWAYGYTHYVLGKTTFAYTIEACSEFQPPANKLDQIVDENFDGALYLLQEAENIKNNVVPRVIPPEIDEMTSNPDGDYTVSWQQRNPDADPDFFQLDELTGLLMLTDDAESGSTLWELDGFSLSDSRFYSDTHSYKSCYKNEDVSSMTTVYPIPVINGMKFSFWCWYDIEEGWDHAFVEVSRNGRSYDILDKFTGSSSGWKYKEYDLSEYADESVFVRFRYTTDENTIEEGFYVDDISPVVDFEIVITLSNSIADNYYKITGKQNDIYYYRVKGHNAEHGWGDFSTLEQINVGVEDNDPPNTPIIDGPSSGKIGTEYTYTISTSDPNGDQVSYLFDWGDETNSGWVGPYDSGQTASKSHVWSAQGSYSIKAKAKDINGAESVWSDPLSVSMPRNKPYINTPFLNWLMLQFPLLARLIQLPVFEKLMNP